MYREFTYDVFFTSNCKVSNKKSEQRQMCVSHAMTEWKPVILDSHFTGCQTEVFFFFFNLFPSFYVLSFIYFISFHKG